MIALQQSLQPRPCCGPGRPFCYTGPDTAPISKSATVWFITRYVLRLHRRRLLAKATTVKVLITDIKQNSVVSTANRISSTSSGILWLKGHSCKPCACNIWLFPNGTFDNNKISLSLGIQRQKFLTRLLSLPCWLGSCLYNFCCVCMRSQADEIPLARNEIPASGSARPLCNTTTIWRGNKEWAEPSQ